jgi:iron complex outermembrane recepter protein
MKRNHLSFAIALTLGMAANAQAQQATTQARGERSEAATLGAIEVTARRREETIQDVPVAVTAFTPAALDKLNIRDIGDLGSQVPNLTIYAARGSSSTVTAYIRGVGQSDPLWGVDPGVGIYLDDVYMARPQGGLLEIFDVERIEVLRGPQGTLYGKNTIGGAIKYITKGLPVETEGFVQATVGNYGQSDLKATIGGSVGEGALRGRIGVASLHRDGFGENIRTGQDVSDKEILVTRAQLGAYVTDDFNLQLSIDWLDDQSGARAAQMLAPNALQGVFFPGTAVNQPLPDRYDVRSGMLNVNDTELRGVSGVANWRINDDWAAKYIVAKREGDTETNIDFDTLPQKIADVKAFYRDQQVSNEIQLNYDAGGRGRGVFGIYHFDGEAGGRVLNNFFNLLFGDTQGTMFTESIAVYGDWSFDLNDKWKLDLGARWTDETKHAVVLNRGYSNDTYTTPISTAANFNKRVGFTNFAPKVGLGYQATDDVLLYGLATRGFKSGGFNIRAQSVAVPRSAEPFDDEVVDSFELGAKMGLFDQTLLLNTAYFYNKYEDIQLSIFTQIPNSNPPAFFGDFTNAGEGTVQGVELEYQWLPSSGWLISGNLAWLDAEFDEYIFKGVNIANQQKFTNAPEFTGALNVERRFQLANGDDLSFRVGYSYQSDVVATTEIVRDPITGAVTKPITQDGYGLLGATLLWKTGDAWTVSLQGSNLADKEYLTTGYVIPALGVRTGFYGAPRQYSLSVRYDF